MSDNEIATILAVLERLESGQAQLRSDVSQLRSDVSQLRSDVSQIRESQAQLRAELLSELARTRADLMERIDRLQGLVAERCRERDAPPDPTPANPSARTARRSLSEPSAHRRL